MEQISYLQKFILTMDQVNGELFHDVRTYQEK